MSPSELDGVIADDLEARTQGVWHAAQAIDRAGRAAEVSDAAIQNLMSAALKLYSAKIDARRSHFSPVREDANITATEAAVLTVELMHVVNLNLFDLSMWASRPRD